MKRKDRHQLKQNDLVHTIVAAREAIETHKTRIAAIAVGVLVVVAVVFAITAWQRRGNAEADQSLAEAMQVLNAEVIPASPATAGELPAAATMAAVGSYPSQQAKLEAALPKLQATAETYPDSDAGMVARYHYASALSALGRHDDAVAAYDAVIDRAGTDNLYGRMARMGKADTLVRAGQSDAAIALWNELAQSADDTLPKDAILMELARAYQAGGQTEEARRTYTQIVEEYPTSQYSAEARAELGS